MPLRVSTMDLLIVMGWVLLCDIIMVFVTYKLAFREGKKARDEVIEKYDHALGVVYGVSDKVQGIKVPTADEIIAKLPPYPHVPTADEIIAKIPPFKLTDEEKKELRETITGAINGCVGSYIKKGNSAAEELGITPTGEMDMGQMIMKMVMDKFK